MKSIMKVFSAGLVLAAFLFLGNTTLKAQNCNQQQAQGIAHSELASCAAGMQQNLEINYVATPNSIGGWTVSVYGQPRCRPGQICPLYIVLIGQVELDGNCNVISSSCGFSTN